MNQKSRMKNMTIWLLAIISFVFVFLHPFITKSEAASLEEQEEAIDEISQYVLKYDQEGGILPSVKIAQIMLETGYLTSELWLNAYNPGGLKFTEPFASENPDAWYSKVSLEEVNGETIPEESKFRKFASADEGIKDMSEFYTSTSWRENYYQEALQADNYADQAKALSGKYATDSNYGTKLIAIIETHELYRFDPVDSRPVENTDSNFKNSGSESSEYKVTVSFTPKEETKFTTSSLYIRPSKESNASLGIVDQGVALTGYEDGAWFKTTYKGQTAYVANAFLSDEPVSVEKYTQTSLFVRPSKNSSLSLGILDPGTKLSGVEEGPWFKTTYNGEEAYVASALLSDKAPVSVEETLYATGPVYIRPSKNSNETLGIADANMKFVGRKDGAWFKTSYHGQEAYICYSLLSDQEVEVLEAKYASTSIFVRPEPNSSQSLGIIDKNTEIQGYSNGGAWFKFKYNNQEAYIAYGLLEDEALIETEVLYAQGDIFIRPYPGAKSDLGILDKNQAVQGYKQGAWFKFNHKGQDAYVAYALLDIEPVGFPMAAGSVDRYAINQFEWRGIIHWNGYTYSYYSERVLPGYNLRIPGRHTEDGFVRDKDDYIVVASDYYAKGTVIPTPFGADAKVYDRFGTGQGRHRVDVYTR